MSTVNSQLSTTSHWWGFAAMQESMVYPSNGEDNPLTLVCQFHLGTGMVYVLADLDYFFGDNFIFKLTDSSSVIYSIV